MSALWPHVFAILGLAAACAAWVLIQRARGRDAAPGCGGGGCGRCGTNDAPPDCVGADPPGSG